MEDKIRKLCEQLVAEKGDTKLALIVELRDALHQHVQRLRAKVAQYPRAGERRTAEKKAEGTEAKALLQATPASDVIQ